MNKRGYSGGWSCPASKAGSYAYFSIKLIKKIGFLQKIKSGLNFQAL